MQIRFLSPASVELDEAIRYYDHQLPGLGFRFFQEVNAAVDRIKFVPEAWTETGDRTRRWSPALAFQQVIPQCAKFVLNEPL
ncbi:MAG: hypothetical protein ACP5SH_23665, partial [Syntrophobacteraceae bacterium]